MINNSEVKIILERIYKAQVKVKKLVDKVESCGGLLNAYDSDTWTWGMHVDKQGGIMTPEESFNLYLKFKGLAPDS